jgi:hypothetical protein
LKKSREGKHCTKHSCTTSGTLRKQEYDENKAKVVSHVENGDNEPVENDDGDADVGCGPPRDGKGRSDVGDLTPIEGEEAHRHSMVYAKQLVYRRVVGGYPTNPREVGESGEEIGRQEI